ncbi:MAG: glycoside hydrolase family 16 protein [Chitinophagaceae bacterium]|nr:glycoside hydrolase family 16 protein [Chitinophagaceae bacterium]
MFKPLSLYLCLFCCILAGCGKSSSGTGSSTPPTPVTPSTPPADKPYQLVWSDEFNSGSAPDTAKWRYDVGGSGWGNNELEYYTNARPENARIENGNLVIEARKENFGGRNYTSARLLTKAKMQWTYGRFEIRAKLPKGRGTWPAIWLLSANDPLHWPDDGELDIMEEVGYMPNTIYGTAHNKLYNGGNGKQKGSSKLIPDAQDSFHVYSLEWTASQVIWSIDGDVFFSYYDPALGSDAWPYNKDFFMILNLAIGGNWGGAQGVDDSIFPQSMLVDYVRVYQKK